ncbi:FERM and PDZ domain-containing protein 1 isoform X2 [Xiphophorus hellerii]|uniref:FERM and PDZ domain-containing protein 1 isoform X2 n=1 Tax=Xiphophorus hellerii TaxID=8084 RepID=UPI0013B3EFA9|nr:FERM and PDZ domain-containing protein 1-like isoform X2 [Xiphophorus hellerii]
MESQDRSRSPSRRTSRVEQVVGRWLRRSRDLGSRSHSLSRDRAAVDGKTGESGSSDQRNYPFRFNVQIQKDPDLNSHGLTLSSQIPILVQEVTTGGPADGRLVPGDQLVKINNVAVDDLTPEQAAEIIRECQDTLTMTVLRIMHGPKSSFITPEKRAKLRSNPVKVHFAEEVEVNGQSQGNSLLFLPNVLKVYLENGQTKAFKFETSTTVKDIVMTLKEKLSLNRIEHFSLVLEQQHNSSKLLLLHEEERIHQVVQKKEVHNYRCLFRVCFMPKDFKTLLQEDPTAFEYLYLQGVNDVLQERYAVEMRCNTALRLAALHIQERLVSCGLSPKANLKMITKTWGIENFVSSTLLRNMREKDLRKAIGFHMKKTQSQHDPKQKSLSVDQARINYLEELSDLKSFGGKSFGATLMLQDRESMVSLLVGARYGVSQVVNHKLSIMTTLTEFNSITRVELLPESDKVSLVKIYLQDIKPITLLLEAGAAKDISCLIAGYCRVFIDPNLNVFPWIDDKKHRVSAEEGYVSRCASDSEDSSDLDMEPLYSLTSQDDKPRTRVRSLSDSEGRKRKDRDRMRSKDCKEKGDAPVENKKPKQEKYLDTPRASASLGNGSQTEMKLDTVSILSLSDIRVSVTDTEMDKREDQEERESNESTFLLRKKSRKRRSFMETDYTSRVTYPETDIESESNLNSYRFLKNISTGPNDNPTLTLDPEPSGQTQNPSPTTSSLTHSEGEPAQLESKPILSKLCSHDPGFLSASEKNRNLSPPSRTRKQEMEMEPDAMESKSVTDLVKVVPPTITVVRCRVDPDGKESADRRGDGNEEGEDQEEMGEKTEEAEKENPAGLTGNGPLFLPDTVEEHGKEEKKETVFDLSSSLKRPLVGAEIPQGAIIMPNSFTEVNERLVTAHINKHVDKNFLSLISPPPPPPSPLLPQTPPALKPETELLIKEAEISKNIPTSINPTAVAPKEQSNNHCGSAKLLKQALISVNDEELIHESTESSNSDNVFDDEDDADASNSLSYTSGKKPKDRTVSANSCLGNYLTQGTTDETHIRAQLLLNLELQNRGHSVNADHILAIKSIRAKLGAATSIMSSLNSGTALKNTVTPKPKSDSTLMSSGPAESLGSPGIVMAKAATLNDLSKELPPPSRFILQTCSPSIMGRLSASTLRGKIQNLPLYLSRSQENLTQAGVGSSAPSPAGEASSDNACTTDSVPIITQTPDLETCIAPDSVESDDSDATLTGSELDGEFFVETTAAKRSPLASEKKEDSCQLPVQTEPKQHHQTLCSRPNDNTPGPITEPPASITSLFQRNTSGLNTNIPGPVTDAPELNIKVNSLQEDIPGYKGSSQSPIVVTTQNLNGPQLAFHGQSQKARTSSDRPLMGLCSPLEQTSDPSKVSSAGCRVFTICEDLSQTSTPADLVATTPLKSEFGCSSILASGCESVAEGIQVPLDACGCPTSYTDCFSGEDSFDDELTVYEFSCRSQNSGISQTSRAGLHLITSPPVPSFISASSTLSPSFPQTILFSSSTSELSPLLSPHSDTSESYLSETHKDTLTHLGQQHYPEPPKGFQVLRRDVDKLLSILEGSGGSDRSVAGLGGRHSRDTCPAHFTENKRVLQLEARRLMSSCQKVAGTGQSPEEMLRFLADSFRTLVELATVCLWFSGCERCDRRNTEAVAGLADVARSFRDFCLAAERASSKRSCQDLSTKLLAKQCTALTASVFCLTQLFRTLTAL